MNERTEPDDLLARHAGPIAVGAGTLLVLVDLARLVLIRPDDRIVSLSNPVAQVANAGYFFTFVGLVIALIAIQSRQRRQVGGFGLVAFIVALLGTMTQAGNMWFDGFAAPWLAEVLPQAFSVRKTTVLLVGALLSYLLFSLGWVLYGIACLRGRVFPLVLGIAVMAAGILGFNSGMPPNGVPMGLAIAGLGAWLIYRSRVTSRVVAPSPEARVVR